MDSLGNRERGIERGGWGRERGGRERKSKNEKESLSER